MDIELLKKLCDAPGVSGREHQVREITAGAMAPLVDRLHVDTLGNLVGVKKGTGPKVLICGHMDEIGFAVSRVDSKGFLRLISLGSNRPDVMEAQRVAVHGEQVLPGLLFRERGLEEKRPPRLEEFFVDLGLPREKVEQWVPIGTPVTISRDLVEVGDTLCSKAMDDRVGVFVMIEALRKLRSHQAEIYAVASVQEEKKGGFGMEPGAYALDPDVAIALDVCSGHDIPGIKEFKRGAELGKGAAIAVKDHGLISDMGMVQSLSRIGREEGIPHQLNVAAGGGTDAAAIHLIRRGVPSISISIPCRYVHTSVELVHKGDVDACSDLLACFLEVAHEVDFGEARELK